MKRTARILLVEDDPSLGLLLHDLLRLEGHKVELLRDGREVMPAFAAQDFDLAILDIMLPGRDGFTLTEDLRQVAPDCPSCSSQRATGSRIGSKGCGPVQTIMSSSPSTTKNSSSAFKLC